MHMAHDHKPDCQRESGHAGLAMHKPTASTILRVAGISHDKY